MEASFPPHHISCSTPSGACTSCPTSLFPRSPSRSPRLHIKPLHPHRSHRSAIFFPIPTSSFRTQSVTAAAILRGDDEDERGGGEIRWSVLSNVAATLLHMLWGFFSEPLRRRPEKPSFSNIQEIVFCLFPSRCLTERRENRPIDLYIHLHQLSFKANSSKDSSTATEYLFNQ